jgi:hypothetical protein
MGCCVAGCAGSDYSSGYCSKHYNRLRTRGTIEDGAKARAPFTVRLWRQIAKGGPDECWPWTAKSRISGYGTISTGGRRSPKVLAHRAVWEEANGPIPDGPGYHGMVVMHTCDNRLCCNPAHLVLGTQTENVRDMDGKGRRKSQPSYGEKHGNATFSNEDIAYIRASPKTNAELTREFGCGRSSIYHIRSFNTRLHG